MLSSSLFLYIIIELLHFIKLFDFLGPIFYYTSHLILLAVVTQKFLNTPFYFLKCEQIQIYLLCIFVNFISQPSVGIFPQLCDTYRPSNRTLQTIQSYYRDNKHHPVGALDFSGPIRSFVQISASTTAKRYLT